MEALDYVALGSFLVLVLAWVVLPIKTPIAIAPAAALEPAAVAA
jgi:hypothetical protein